MGKRKCGVSDGIFAGFLQKNQVDSVKKIATAPANNQPEASDIMQNSRFDNNIPHCSNSSFKNTNNNSLEITVSQLRNWFVKNKIRTRACDEILQIFRNAKIRVPCSTKQLMKVDNRNINIIEISSGEYCDAPARALLAGVVGHTNSHGCSKCTQEAKRINNRLTYSTEIAELRTDDDFKKINDKLHHCKKVLETRNVLEEIDIDMVTQISLDPMHLIDLGCTKKILRAIWKNQHKWKNFMRKKKVK